MNKIRIADGFSYIIAAVFQVVGVLSYIFTGLAIIVSIGEKITPLDISMFLFFGIIGFVLCRSAKKIRVNRENIKQYLSIIVDGGIYRLDNIAAARGKTYEAVKRDVQKMIQKGYLNRAYIDESTGEVVLLGVKVKEVEKTEAVNRTSPQKPEGKKITCSCCGATNTITGESGECEYCGALLK